MMRNMSDVNQLKKEFKFEQQKLNTLLWRLVPQKISEKFLTDDLKDIIVGKNCAIMCATAKTAVKPELRLTELDVTEIIMSLSDKIMSQNKNIMRLRTFNGTFLFIAGLFEEKSCKENIEDLIRFCDECGKKVKDIFKKKQSLCGLIKSGIVYGYMSGISKTIFDVLSDSAIEVFDLIDVVPAGKLCILKDEYEAINDADKRFVAYLPPRDVDVELYINRGE
ncbi:adenylate cyclase, putative [Trichomonas vaginalis G3]|uniref:Adenylate cyclase, putative n=1 Tax=Trichomonas vaginalis (strain ATCC PRA-98 / G3) TaxID=412133 RepID=A2EXU5_TRIV3|nr:hypothetical protein TVAGG3_0654020 [Trichomonas vaginalis G3]EAY02549.1 adenylate cyclase, putative [Trichomonas vaginalis G3]KAI5506041.1 hypothetical protein TVAGG3_0654020 [Trichomonas vaginalis G3]|eukprot:XP_001314788.1 adenylate cyclase [Trichomonas vaginalis G3]